MKAEKGRKYDMDTTQIAGWATATDITGYCVYDYFSPEGEYLGPDMYGVEPEFIDLTPQ